MEMSQLLFTLKSGETYHPEAANLIYNPQLLNQVVGQIDLGVKLTKLDQRFLFFSTQFFRSAKKQEGSLS